MALQTTKKIKLYEQYRKDINKMTNWQNSQWLRSGAEQGTTGFFLNLKRRP